MRSALPTISESFRHRLPVGTHPPIVSLEAFSLPDWHIDRIDAIADPCDDSSDDQLPALHCTCLQDGPNNHDPASPHDATFSTIFVSCQKCHNCAYETAEVVDAGDDALELGAWIVETGAKGWQADDSAQNALIIAKKLVRYQSVRMLTMNLSAYMRHIWRRFPTLRKTKRTSLRCSNCRESIVKEFLYPGDRKSEAYKKRCSANASYSSSEGRSRQRSLHHL